MSIEELLKIIKRTNPDMTKERMLTELKENKYSSVALIMSLESKSRLNAYFLIFANSSLCVSISHRSYIYFYAKCITITLHFDKNIFL